MLPYTKLSISTWGKNSADHAWHNKREKWQDFDVSCQEASTLCMGQTFSRQSSLNNDL